MIQLGVTNIKISALNRRYFLCFAKFLLILSLLMSSQPSVALNKVLLVPTSAVSESQATLGNVITVASENGDFTDPVTALASLNADSDHRYLVVIAPGTYQITSPLVMKEYVDVVGSGQNVTRLVGSPELADQSVIEFSVKHATLANLSVSRNGLKHETAAVLNIASGAIQESFINDLTVKAYSDTSSNAAKAVRIMNAAPVLNRVEVLAYGGVSATGIYIGGGRPVINETNVRALSATASIAIEIYASLLTTLNGVSITAQARSTAWGLRLFESKIIANRFTAKISGSNTSTLYGIENTSFLERDSSLPLLNIELSRAKIYSEGGAHAYGIRLQPVTGRAGLGESNYRAVAKLDRIDITSQGIGYKYGIYNGSRKKMEISKATIYSNPQITINRSGIYSDNYSSTYIHNSHVWSADTNAVPKYAPELRLYNSFIEQANSDNDSLNIKCYLVVSGSEELGEDCTL